MRSDAGPGHRRSHGFAHQGSAESSWECFSRERTRISLAGARSSRVACADEILPSISVYMKTAHPVRLRCLIALFLAGLSSVRGQTAKDGEWPHYGNDEGGMRYSKLTQINRDNVAQLKPAWTLHTDDISDGSGHRERSGLETTPIMVPPMCRTRRAQLPNTTSESSGSWTPLASKGCPLPALNECTKQAISSRRPC